MRLPFNVDLSKKIVAITGAAGVICSEFARTLAACGAKVALLDINFEAAKTVADEIGQNAIAIRCDCLDKQSIMAARETIVESFGKVNLLINGAGGNNPRATCDNEVMTAQADSVKNFFRLEESGACRSFCPLQYPCKRDHSGIFRDQSEQSSSFRSARQTYRTHEKNTAGNAHESLRGNFRSERGFAVVVG